MLCSANNNSVITRCGMLLYRVPDVARCTKSENMFSNVGTWNAEIMCVAVAWSVFVFTENINIFYGGLNCGNSCKFHTNFRLNAF